MKLKFYLRGLGIGIVVTAIILHFVLSSSGGEMSDEQIKLRAQELGMIENTVLKPSVSGNSSEANIESKDANIDSNSDTKTDSGSDITVDADKKDTTTVEDANTENANSEDANSEGANLDGTDDSTTIDVDEDKNQDKDAGTNTETDTETDTSVSDNTVSENTVSDENEMKTVVIYAGDGSYAAAKRAYDAGLVDSAAEFDMYLCKNNYDKRLTTGTHYIPAGSTNEEIAKILTSATH